MNSWEESIDTKYMVCENCRNNYPDKLGICQDVADLCCQYCRGVDSNYEALRLADRGVLAKGGVK